MRVFFLQSFSDQFGNESMPLHGKKNRKGSTMKQQNRFSARILNCMKVLVRLAAALAAIIVSGRCALASDEFQNLINHVPRRPMPSCS